MATKIIPCTTSTWTDADIRVTYTASNGTLKVTELEGRAAWASDSWDNDVSSVSLKIGGVTKKVNVSRVYFGANNTWYTWSATDTTWTGLSGSSISFSTTLTSDLSSFDGAKFSGNLSMSWTTYKITYNANGGDLGDVPSYQTKTYGTTLTLTKYKPTKSGYNFLGWSTSSTATTPTYYAGGSYTANAAATLYAVWESANSKTILSLNKEKANLLDYLKLSFNIKDSTNKHTIKWSGGGKTLTSHTKISLSSSGFEYLLSEARFGSWFYSDSPELEITVSVTTYNSSGTSLGTSSESFILFLPEALGKASKPSANVVKNLTGATITMTAPTFKNNATFEEWEIDSDTSNYSISNNTITITNTNNKNKTQTITVRAIDSRGYRSDPIDIVWFLKRRGATIYYNNAWVPAKSYLYNNGWKKQKTVLYNGSNWITIKTFYPK